MEPIKTFCPRCNEHVDAALVERTETLSVRGCPTEYIAHVAVCPICGNDIGDMAVDKKNLNAAYDVYRAEHGIMTVDEIKELRKNYGLSLREFSTFLGFGEQTFARYERGTLPSNAHAFILQQALTPEGAEELLSRSKDKLSANSINLVSSYIASKMNNPNRWGQLETDASGPSKENGYRPLDYDRVAALICALAERCNNLFKTKLQKAMFFSDALACERLGVSLTGTNYAHADHGPIMNNYDLVLQGLEAKGIIRKNEVENGEVIVAIKSNESIFTDDEIELIDEVADFINTFPTASSVSEYSHRLKSWRDTTNGQTIDYNMHLGEVGGLIASRIN